MITEYGIPSDFVRKLTASLQIKISTAQVNFSNRNVQFSESKIINKDNAERNHHNSVYSQFISQFILHRQRIQEFCTFLNHRHHKRDRKFCDYQLHF